MSWTVNQIARNIVEDFGGAADYDTEDVTQTERYVNEAYKVVVRHHRWSWLNSQEPLATVANQQIYELSTPAAEIVTIQMLNGGTPNTNLNRTLVFKARQDLIAANILMNLTGVPVYFWSEGYNPVTSANKYGLWYVPNDVYNMTVQTILRPVDLASGATIPVPEEFIPILTDYARKQRWLYTERDVNSAGVVREDFAVELEALKKRTATEAANNGGMAVADIRRSRGRSFGPFLPPNYPD